MNIHEQLHGYLFRYGCRPGDEITDVRYASVPDTPQQLRDRLLLAGQILEENETDAVYVVRISAGFLRMSSAILAMCLRGDGLYLSGYAREGLIGQRTCAQALAQLEAILNEAFPHQGRYQTCEGHPEMDEDPDSGPDRPGSGLGTDPGPADSEGDGCL